MFDYSIPDLNDFRNSNIIFNNELYFAGSNNLGGELWKLSDNSLSTNDYNKTITQKLNIFPNPASNIVIIKMDDEIEIENVEIYNLLGKKVYTHKTSNQQNTEINISNLSKGMYVVKVKVNNFIISKKLIIQ